MALVDDEATRFNEGHLWFYQNNQTFYVSRTCSNPTGDSSSGTRGVRMTCFLVKRFLPRLSQRLFHTAGLYLRKAQAAAEGVVHGERHEVFLELLHLSRNQNLVHNSEPQTS